MTFVRRLAVLSIASLIFLSVPRPAFSARVDDVLSIYSCLMGRRDVSESRGRLKNAIVHKDREEALQILRSAELHTLHGMMITLQRRMATRDQLRPDEAALWIRFLKWLYEPKWDEDTLELETAARRDHPFLASGAPFSRVDTDLADGLVRVIQWPSVPRRTHGERAPKPHYDELAWKRAFEPFSKRASHEKDITHEFLWMFAMLINHEAQHNRFTHVEPLHEIFYRRLREFALAAKQPRLASWILMGYLQTYQAARSVFQDPDMRTLEAWAELPTGEKRSSSYFLVQLASMTNAQLVRFFSKGVLPRNRGDVVKWSDPTEAVNAMRTVSFYRDHPMSRICDRAMVPKKSRRKI